MKLNTEGLSKNRGSFNKRNTFDWLSDIPVVIGNKFNIIEISFKKGARKGFYRNEDFLELYKGDIVVVQSKLGYDVGEVCLSGELVKMQMKKKNQQDDDTILKIHRKAKPEEIDYLKELRSKEKSLMISARAIAKETSLDMKVSEVEYQGDGKKITIYYTSNGRVDFRELVKKYVNEFNLKIEMRQIGARQESQRLGGVGTCGRELCSATFLNDFKTVSMKAARYQQLSLHSDKLFGQCGKLKYCLTFVLDTYVEALKVIPKKADKLKTKEGTAYLRKTDIFKMEMTYNINKTNQYYKLSVEDVKKVKDMNSKGEIPASLANFNIVEEPKEKEKSYDDLVGQVNLKTLTKKPKNKRNRNKRKRKPNRRRNLYKNNN